jgi:hypothetical protein
LIISAITGASNLKLASVISTAAMLSVVVESGRASQGVRSMCKDLEEEVRVGINRLLESIVAPPLAYVPVISGSLVEAVDDVEVSVGIETVIETNGCGIWWSGRLVLQRKYQIEEISSGSWTEVVGGVSDGAICRCIGKWWGAMVIRIHSETELRC